MQDQALKGHVLPLHLNPTRAQGRTAFLGPEGDVDSARGTWGAGYP